MSKKENTTASLTTEKVWNLIDQNNLPADIEREDSYLETYPEFIAYFKNLKEITYHEAVIGAHAVYGWMPTILTLNDEYKKTIPHLLNLAKKGEELEELGLNKLKKWMNNSIVGVSKLLHFINPEIYPIWDSNINGILFDEWRYDQTNDIKRYMKYQEVMVQCSHDSNFNSLMIENLTVEKNNTLSKLRQIEMKLFYLGKSKKQL